MENKKKKKNTAKKVFGEFFETLCTIVVVIAGILCILYVRIVKVSGNSMENTYRNGQYVIAIKDNNLKRGDIVVFDYNGIYLIKRIIAVGGDTVIVDYDTNTVTVNGEKISEPYLKEEMISVNELEGTEVSYPYTVSEGCYFVMGDNRNASKDSRWFGEITDSSITGKVQRKEK